MPNLIERKKSLKGTNLVQNIWWNQDRTYVEIWGWCTKVYYWHNVYIYIYIKIYMAKMVFNFWNTSFLKDGKVFWKTTLWPTSFGFRILSLTDLWMVPTWYCYTLENSTWNPAMDVWKMIFLFNWMIFRFNVQIFTGVVELQSGQPVGKKTSSVNYIPCSTLWKIPEPNLSLRSDIWGPQTHTHNKPTGVLKSCFKARLMWIIIFHIFSNKQSPMSWLVSMLKLRTCQKEVRWANISTTWAPGKPVIHRVK